MVLNSPVFTSLTAISRLWEVTPRWRIRPGLLGRYHRLQCPLGADNGLEVSVLGDLVQLEKIEIVGTQARDELQVDSRLHPARSRFEALGGQDQPWPHAVEGPADFSSLST